MINFKRSRSVKVPSRAHTHDAGWDFYVPEEFSEEWLLQGQSVNIPSGIHIQIPIGFMGLFLNKSGVAKKGLIIGAQVIDCGYTGEVHLNLHNVSKMLRIIKPGQKIAQLIIVPICSLPFKEIPKDQEFETFGSNRGTGGFGSTGNN